MSAQITVSDMMGCSDMVSVIIPVYNVEAYLDRCINSVLAQTYTNLEILLIDDCSTDSSRKIMNRFANADPRIKCFFQKANRGVSAARNLGISSASGDWICFIDSDDWVSSDYIEKLLSCAENENSEYVVCDYYIAADGKPPISANSIGLLESGCDKKLALACCPLSSCTCLVKKPLFGDYLPPFPENCSQFEELPLIPLLSEKANRIGVVKEPLYYYFQRGNRNSASNKNIDMYEENFLKGISLLRERLGPGYDEELECRAIYALFYGMILNMCKNGFPSGAIRSKLCEYQIRYPNYLGNRYLPCLGKSKQLFLRLESKRLIPLLRLAAWIHGLIVS